MIGRHRLIFSSRIARKIIQDGRFVCNLADIQENRNEKGRTVFAFRRDKEFDRYLKEEFNIK